MKTLPLFLNLVLAVAIAALYYLYFTASTQPKDNTEAIPSKDTSETSEVTHKQYVYINVDTLEVNYLMFKDMRDELATQKLRYESAIKNDIRSLEKEVLEFREQARYMTQQQGEARQMELAQKEQELMGRQEKLNRKYFDSEKEKNDLLYGTVRDFLQRYSKENEYDFIFGYSDVGSVLYASNANDITREVVNGLNVQYEQQKQESNAK
ncbi:MAG: hypothetical protein COA57_02475 [Flavobacteriales bacterium]|nr:MAG: hypothetical protein COA57_02475 [Flavobacteriales bacterium]